MKKWENILEKEKKLAKIRKVKEIGLNDRLRQFDYKKEKETIE